MFPLLPSNCHLSRSTPRHQCDGTDHQYPEMGFHWCLDSSPVPLSLGVEEFCAMSFSSPLEQCPVNTTTAVPPSGSGALVGAVVAGGIVLLLVVMVIIMVLMIVVKRRHQRTHVSDKDDS